MNAQEKVTVQIRQAYVKQGSKAGAVSYKEHYVNFANITLVKDSSISGFAQDVNIPWRG